MYYWVHGFALKSDFELPELREITREEAEAGPLPMVEIVNGPVPEALPGETRLVHWLAHAEGRWLVTIPDVGRLLVEAGRRVVVQKMPDALESDLRTYLLGTGLGALAHQRGLVPLHVGALLSPAGAIAFTGPSGAGKSTAVATLSQELGWPVISDDVAVLSVEEGQVTLEGGVRRIRLWSDALDRLNMPKKGLVRDIHRHDKFLVHPQDLFVSGPHDLALLYEIVPRHSHNGPVAVYGGERFVMLMNAIYRPMIAGVAHDLSGLQVRMAKAVSQIPSMRGNRPTAILAQEFLTLKKRKP